MALYYPGKIDSSLGVKWPSNIGKSKIDVLFVGLFIQFFVGSEKKLHFIRFEVLWICYIRCPIRGGGQFF